MLKIPIKASQIDNLTDARYFAAWGVEWMGFKLDLAENNPQKLSEIKVIKEWLEGPLMLAELDLLMETSDILKVLDYLEFNAVQLGMFASLNQFQRLRAYTLFKEVVYAPGTSISKTFEAQKQFSEYLNYFVLNFKKAGLSWEGLNSLQKEELQAVCEAFPIILNIDVLPEAMDSLLTQNDIEGLELMGGEEEKIGLKSFDQLDLIFEALEE